MSETCPESVRKGVRQVSRKCPKSVPQTASSRPVARATNNASAPQTYCTVTCQGVPCSKPSQGQRSGHGKPGQVKSNRRTQSRSVCAFISHNQRQRSLPLQNATAKRAPYVGAKLYTCELLAVCAALCSYWNRLLMRCSSIASCCAIVARTAAIASNFRLRSANCTSNAPDEERKLARTWGRRTFSCGSFANINDANNSRPHGCTW